MDPRPPAGFLAPLFDDNPAIVDLLGFDAVAEVVAKVVTSGGLDPVTVGIHSAWGGGKSTALNLIADSLDGEDQVVVVRIDPWEFENAEDLRGTLIAQVLDELQFEIDLLIGDDASGRQHEPAGVEPTFRPGRLPLSHVRRPGVVLNGRPQVLRRQTGDTSHLVHRPVVHRTTPDVQATLCLTRPGVHAYAMAIDPHRDLGDQPLEHRRVQFLHRQHARSRRQWRDRTRLPCSQHLSERDLLIHNAPPSGHQTGPAPSHLWCRSTSYIGTNRRLLNCIQPAEIVVGD
jgi:hypothetical protein